MWGKGRRKFATFEYISGPEEGRLFEMLVLKRTEGRWVLKKARMRCRLVVVVRLAGRRRLSWQGRVRHNLGEYASCVVLFFRWAVGKTDWAR